MEGRRKLRGFVTDETRVDQWRTIEHFGNVMIMGKTTILRALGVLALTGSLARAQVFTVGGGEQRRREDGPRSSPVFGGAGAVYGRPTSDFSRYVNQGFGVDGMGRWKVDPRGIFSLGLEGGFLQYGRETIRVPLSSTVGRISVDVTTSNNILFLGFGPQLTVPSGPVRPYVSGGVGFSYLFTESSVEGSDNDNSSFADTKNFDDFVFATTGGGGIYIPLGRTREAALDIGVRYHNGGKGQYLREGGIVDRPGQTPLITPIESQTQFLSWRVGFIAGLGSKR